MAKILCGISGIEFNCDHLPIYLDSREYAHPVFFLPQKKLLGLYHKYEQGALNDTDSYLLFLAYLNSTDLVEWRVPAKYHKETPSIVAQNLELLVRAVELQNRVRNPSVHFSHIAVSPDTCNLTNVSYWIESWLLTYEDFVSGYATQKQKLELAELEEKLDYLSRDGNRSEGIYASRLAAWADKATDFPRFEVKISGASMPCNLYWQQLIRKCANKEMLYSLDLHDLKEITDHVLDRLELGSTYSHDLVKLLNGAAKAQSQLLGFGSFEFSIVSADTSVEQANRLAIMQNAPTEEPKRISYPSTFAYLKAKTAWDMAQGAKNGN